MKSTLKTLVLEAVTDNILFEGSMGTSYSVQDLFHNVNMKTLDTMYQRAKKELNSMEEDSLYKSKGSKRKDFLNLTVSILSEIFTYRKEESARLKELEKSKEERQEKLRILKALKTEKEYEELKSKGAKELEKEIKELEGK